MIKFIIISLTLLISQYSFAGIVNCLPTKQEILTAKTPLFDRNKNVTSNLRDSWAPENFTDPVAHNPQSYRYIIHTIDNFGIKYSAHSTYDFIQTIVAENPCSTISTSIVDQDKRAMFGTVGFILRVPAENILMSGPDDIGSPNLYTNIDPSKFHHELVNFFDSKNRPRFLTPGEVLVSSDPNHWNEVLVQSKVYESVKITAIFISNSKMTYGGIEKYAALLQELKELAVEKGLPLINLLAEPNRLP